MRATGTLMDDFDPSRLLRGERDGVAVWITGADFRLAARNALLILAGGGAFGAAVGSWRAPEQAAWAAVKLPFVLLGTASGNALINGMLAPLLGIDLRMRASFAAVLASFGAMAIILGSLSPLVAFLAWNAPLALAASPEWKLGQSVMLVALVGGIALAGTIGNIRLFGWLTRVGGRAPARRLLFAWLAVNLLLGVQVCWILRPFVGAADESVAFFEVHALQGSFIEEAGDALLAVLRHFFVGDRFQPASTLSP